MRLALFWLHRFTSITFAIRSSPFFVESYSRAVVNVKSIPLRLSACSRTVLPLAFFRGLIKPVDFTHSSH